CQRVYKRKSQMEVNYKLHFVRSNIWLD
uniref:SVMP n=1 Tax=Meloidogyne hapla TaxID=6305 RepID=A0A1I8BVP0_MELHA